MIDFKPETPYGITWFDIFSSEDIKLILNIFENYEYKKATVNNNIISTHRKSNIKWIPCDEQTKWIYDKIANEVLKLNSEIYEFQLSGAEAMQYTEYDSIDNGTYKFHNDLLNVDNKCRKLSISILLSDEDEFGGGQFIFSPDGGSNLIFPPTKCGRAILFPSWIPHCVNEITEGKRKSLVMWFFGEKFK
jgi:PKHD-type hydroxylase